MYVVKLYFSTHQIIWSRYSLSSLLLESVTEGDIRGMHKGARGKIRVNVGENPRRLALERTE